MSSTPPVPLCPPRPKVTLREALKDAPATIIVGHRGTGRDRRSNPWTENTLASFRRALDDGADMIELDVQMTSDGELVVYHDPRVKQRHLRRPLLGKLASYQLADVKLRGGETVPTLKAVFDEILPLRAQGLLFDVEIKPQKGVEPREVVHRLRDVISLTAARNRCLFTSFSLPVLVEARQAMPDAWCLWLVTRFRQGLQQILAGEASHLGLEGLVVQHHRSPFDIPYTPSVVTRRLTRRALEAGLLLGAYTVNRPRQLKRMRDLGVRFIVTDHPARAAEVLGREERREK